MECIFRCPVIMSMLVVRRVVLPAELVFLIYRTLFLPLLAIEIGSTFFKQTGKVCGRRRRSNWGRSERGYWWEKERLSFPFPFCAFLPLPSPPLPFLCLPRRLRKVLLLRYTILVQYNTIQYNSWVFLVYCTLFLLGLSCFRKCWFYSLFIHLFFNLNGFSSFTGI